MAGRTKGGAGDAAHNPYGGGRPVIPGLRRCGARGRGSQPRTRAASGLRPEALRPPARSWLTTGGHVCAAARKRGPAQQGKRRDGAPEGAPAPVWAGCLRPNFRRQARPRGGPPGASVNRASAVQRSIPLTFLGGDEPRRSPRATTSGRRSVGCLTIESDDRASRATDVRVACAASSLPVWEGRRTGAWIEEGGRGAPELERAMRRGAACSCER
ncbi:MAG: hypothetical protein QOH67_3752 [Hyphomicrobiales bacterium]|jgi:hypothetical protein|nr:hypothetical protein [Hyphomicrobiales bacterium]